MCLRWMPAPCWVGLCGGAGGGAALRWRCVLRALLSPHAAVCQSPAFPSPPILCACEASSFAWEERPWKQGWTGAGENELTPSSLALEMSGRESRGPALRGRGTARAAVWKWGMLGSRQPRAGHRGSRRQLPAPGAGPWR